MADPTLMRSANELLRTDFSAFVGMSFRYLYASTAYHQNWHLLVMCDALMDSAGGDTRRLLICAPPRHLKSFVASVCYPAWLLGNDPTRKIICISYAQELSEPFAHQCLQLMQAPWFKRAFPKCRIDPKRRSKANIGTTRNGHRLASSVTGSLTGKGGDFLIADDLIKAGDVNSETVREKVNLWFDETLQSRLDDPKTGRIIVVAQRLHVDDLPGRLIERGGWREMILPLIAQEQESWPYKEIVWHRAPGTLLHEERFGEAEAEAMRKSIGSFLFEAQYNQRPALAGGSLIKLEWLKYDETPMDPRFCDHIIQSWDTATVADEGRDYTVCATFGVRGGTYHLLDIYRDRIEFPQQVAKVKELRRKWGAHLVIFEKAGSGVQLFQQFTQDHDGYCCWAAFHTPKGSKAERAQKQTVKFERGQVRLHRQASWRQSLEQEIIAFPKGKHDDQVDAVVQFLATLDTPSIAGKLQAARR